ncbi:MAG: hypothetical protein FJ121_11715 [Deltaproteobacteria bacterium]|nr:hypothetical protein [Deltaproteobacteria bacterium]
MPHDDPVARALVGAVLGGTAALCIWLWKKFQATKKITNNKEAERGVALQPHEENDKDISEHNSNQDIGHETIDKIIDFEEVKGQKPEQEAVIISHGNNQSTTQPHPTTPKNFKLFLIGAVLIGALFGIVFIMLSGQGPEGARTKLLEMNIPFNEQVFFERIYAGDVFIVELFLNAGVSPNLKDKEGYPALMRAAQRGHSSIIRSLLKHGAEVNITQNNITALDIAEIREHQEISKILRSAGGLTAMGLLDRQYPIAPVQKKPEVRRPKPEQNQTYPNLPEPPTPRELTMDEREAYLGFDVKREKEQREAGSGIKK